MRAIPPSRRLLSVAPLAATATVLALAGTVTGQAVLVKDLNTTPAAASGAGSNPFDNQLGGQTAQVGAYTWFVATNATHGRELYFTLGSATIPSPPSRVDIFSGPSSSRPNGLTPFKGNLYFFAETPAAGRELMRISLSAPTSPTVVADLNPGAASSSVGYDTSVGTNAEFGAMAELKGELLFVVDAPAVAGLYKTNGTTVTLLKRLRPTPPIRNFIGAFNEPELRRIAVANGLAFFGGDDGSGKGQELWKSDGTPAGTTLVRDINTGTKNSSPRAFAALGNQVLFAADDGTTGFELWASDGTTTTRLADIDTRAGRSGNPQQFHATTFGGKLSKPVALFYASNQNPTGGTGNEIYITDGTAAGTKLLKDLNPGSARFGLNSSSPANFVEVNGTVYFLAILRPFPSDRVLAKTDGTAAGTVYTTGNGGLDSSTQDIARGLVASGGKLFYFSKTTAVNNELFVYDPTSNTHAPVADVSNKTFVANSDEDLVASPIWKSVVYFHDDGRVGSEPWVTDGTAANTKRLADINSVQPGATQGASALNATFTGYGPFKFATLGLKSYFFANDGSGIKLFETDGTTAGTSAVSPIHSGRFFGAGGIDAELSTFAYRDRVYAVMSQSATGRELFSYVPASATFAIADDSATGSVDGYGSFSPIEIAGLNGKIYHNPKGALRRYDPVLNTAVDLGASLPKPVGSVADLSVVGGKLYFTAKEQNNNTALFVTDGTAAGTVKLTPDGTVANGTRTAAGGRVVGVNGLGLFAGTSATNGRELWVTNGTPAGTKMLVDLNSGTGSSFGTSNTSEVPLTAFRSAAGERAVFSADVGGGLGKELYITDGTAAGTKLLKDIHVGSESAWPSFAAYGSKPAQVGNQLVFVASDGKTGAELWITDGTTAGTKLLKDIRPGFPSSGIGFLRAIGSRRAYFIAADPAGGNELWRTDGTAAGTIRMADVRVGNASGVGSRNSDVGYVANKVLFGADDGRTGNELWAIDAGATAMPVGMGHSGYALTWYSGITVEGGGTTNGTGLEPKLYATDPVFSSSFRMTVRDAAPSAGGVILVGVPAAPNQFLGINLYLNPASFLLVGVTANSSGTATFGPVSVPASPVLINSKAVAQAAMGQANGVAPLGIAASGAVYFTVGY